MNAGGYYISSESSLRGDDLVKDTNYQYIDGDTDQFWSQTNEQQDTIVMDYVRRYCPDYVGIFKTIRFAEYMYGNSSPEYIEGFFDSSRCSCITDGIISVNEVGVTITKMGEEGGNYFQEYHQSSRTHSTLYIKHATYIIFCENDGSLHLKASKNRVRDPYTYNEILRVVKNLKGAL